MMKTGFMSPAIFLKDLSRNKKTPKSKNRGGILPVGGSKKTALPERRFYIKFMQEPKLLPF